MNKENIVLIKSYLDDIYSRYAYRKFVSPDPLEFLYHYKMQEDIEIMGIIASSLAIGQVKQILKSVQKIENVFKHKPYEYLINGNLSKFINDLSSFKHRFTKGIDFAKFLEGLRLILKEYGTIEEAFLIGYSQKDLNTNKALDNLYKLISDRANSDLKNIFPNPAKKSACKRMHLFLRWMVRDDAVDLGIWKSVDKSKLLVPLDTHILDIAKILNFIDKKQNNIKTAIKITEYFKMINTIDPIKYDFSLTRPGIRNESEKDFLQSLQELSINKIANNTQNKSELNIKNKRRRL